MENAIHKKLKELLRDIPTDHGRHKQLWEDYKANDYVNKPLPKDEKSADRADFLKGRGNAYYSKRFFREALIAYNEALCKSPKDSPLIPILYSNRSAVYLAAKLPMQSMENIDLALESGYPAENRYKLEDRRTHCLEMLDRMADDQFDYRYNPIVPIALSHPVHSKYAFISEAVDFEVDSENGPKLVAKQNLQPGDVFMLEPLFLQVVDYSNKGDNFARCTWCLQPFFLSLLPCPGGCTSAMWCKDCLEKFGELHKRECSVWTYANEKDKFTSLFVRSLTRILAFYDFKLERLEKEMTNIREYPEKVLEGDYVNDPERQVVKWVLLCWTKLSYGDWLRRAIRAPPVLNMLMLDTKWKELISSPRKELIVLDVLISLACQNTFELSCELIGKETFMPLRCQFSTNSSSKFKACVEPTFGQNYAYMLRPAKKGDIIRILTPDSMSFAFPKDPDILQSLNDGNPKPFIDHLLSRMPKPKLRTCIGISISDFDLNVEIFRAIHADPSYEEGGFLKHKKRFVRILTEYDSDFPCAELALVMWCFQMNISALHLDLDHYHATNMIPNNYNLDE